MPLGWRNFDEIQAMLDAFVEASCDHNRLSNVFPSHLAKKLLKDGFRILRAEENVVDVPRPSNGGIHIVGDIHGQLHDLVSIFGLCGRPGPDNILVFNGDYVDRGSWGIEVLLILVAAKVAFPRHVFLLRGNHETRGCIERYGFSRECLAKYQGSEVLVAAVDVFRSLPLIAVVGQTAMVVHGGLWRKAGSKKLVVGSLADIRGLQKRDRLKDDFDRCVYDELLWSDPCSQQGIHANTVRGGGLLWGPDITQQFLVENKLRLIIRSHEGPDARVKRPDMQPMNDGYTVDHTVDAGKLVTVFSAPDYPQFQVGSNRYKNKGAVITLLANALHDPQVHSYEAKERPEGASVFYDVENVPDSDEGSVCSHEEDACGASI